MTYYQVNYKRKDGETGNLTLQAKDAREAIDSAFKQCTECHQVIAAFPIIHETHSN